MIPWPGTSVGVSVGVDVGVGVNVSVGVSVSVGVDVGVPVGVTVGVWLGVGVWVGVCDGVTVEVGVNVTVEVLVGVDVEPAAAVPCQTLPFQSTAKRSSMLCTYTSSKLAVVKDGSPVHATLIGAIDDAALAHRVSVLGIQHVHAFLKMVAVGMLVCCLCKVWNALLVYQISPPAPTAQQVVALVQSMPQSQLLVPVVTMTQVAPLSDDL